MVLAISCSGPAEWADEEGRRLEKRLNEVAAGGFSPSEADRIDPLIEGG
jgi:hypothetical protein